MKKTILFLFFIILSVNCAFAEVTARDYSSVKKITKELKKASDKTDIEKISNFYSEDFKSFDGYGKAQVLELYLAAKELYSNMKTKEKICSIDVEGDLVKVILKENAKAKIDSKKNQDKKSMFFGYGMKGNMEAYTYYANIFKKENGEWKIIKDEVFEEETKLSFGEAKNVSFNVQTPSYIEKGEQYDIKSTVEIPKKRIIVGSVGNDRIEFPPKKLYDPFRAYDARGVLERIVIANNDGKNEYASAFFAFVEPEKVYRAIENFEKNNLEQNKATLEMTISGLGFYIKRVNVNRADSDTL